MASVLCFMLLKPEGSLGVFLWISAIYTTGLGAVRLANGAHRREGSLLLLGLLDATTVAAVAYLFPHLWQLGLVIQLTIVGMGWIESRRVTAILLTVAATSMGIVGASHGIDRWGTTLALFVLATGAVSVNAMWSVTDLPLSAVGESLTSVRALVWQADLDSVLTEIAGPTVELMGLPAAQMIGRPMTAFLAAEDGDNIQDWRRELAATGSVSFVHQLQASDDLTARTTLRLVRHSDGESELHGVTVDISKAWRASEPQRRRESLVQQMRDGILLLSRHRTGFRIDQINSTGAQLLGVAEQVDWPRLATEHPALCAKVAELDPSEDAVVWRHRVDTQAQPIWLSVRCYEVGDGSIALQFSDVSDDIREEDRIRHEASHDALTGLLNLRAFRDRLGRRLEDPSLCTVFLLDLNGFKAVNDQLGHGAGDEVLIAIAKRLRHCTKDSDMIARLGGDEFVGLLDGALDALDVQQLRHRLQTAIAEPVTLSNETTVRVSAAIGFATRSVHDTIEDLVSRADGEMYTNKRHHKVQSDWVQSSSTDRPNR